ncbi:uncharacterized protein [Elaeis guineensis]|uniref:Uncharacterized protein LOC105035190 isoform X4 n=1 Tax=Elaeis guineensis var. tenera TaxID=51953 RepID=A0A6I9QGR1_ELAGV|nr:uncharacterized protein LOC105035190 isoform X4 [Elaeis guineensis]
MDEREFRRLLDLFPVVRSRNYCADSEPSRGSTSHSPQDEVADWRNARNEMDEKDVSEGTYNEDTFWQKLRLAAERKVYEELSFDVAQRFMNAEGK